MEKIDSGWNQKQRDSSTAVIFFLSKMASKLLYQSRLLLLIAYINHCICMTNLEQNEKILDSSTFSPTIEKHSIKCFFMSGRFMCPYVSGKGNWGRTISDEVWSSDHLWVIRASQLAPQKPVFSFTKDKIQVNKLQLAPQKPIFSFMKDKIQVNKLHLDEFQNFPFDFTWFLNKFHSKLCL